MDLTFLPTLNAVLNGTAAVLLSGGYALIRRGRRRAHKACMLGAVAVSALFLCCYLLYHYHAGSVPYRGQGWLRPAYFTILISHSLLAAAILPMVMVTLVRAFKRQFDRHARIARWTLPLWIYVSATGVVIYLMLYHGV